MTKDYKKKYQLLLKDWDVLSKRYMELMKKFKDVPKRNEELDNLLLMLKNHDKRINLLVSCVNKLGEELSK